MLGPPVYQNLGDITSKTQTTDDNTYKFMEFILSSFFLEGGGEHFLHEFVCYFMKGTKIVVHLDTQSVNIDSHFINGHPVLSVFSVKNAKCAFFKKALFCFPVTFISACSSSKGPRAMEFC